MKNDNDDGAPQGLDDDKDFEEVFGGDQDALAQLLKFAQEGPFEGWETLSDLKEPERINHLRLKVLGWLVKEIDAEVTALATGERREENTFGPLLEMIQEKDLKLRVSHKRKGRGELVNMIIGGKQQEAKRKWLRGR